MEIASISTSAVSPAEQDSALDPATDEHEIITTSRDVNIRTALVSEYVIDGVLRGDFKLDPAHNTVHKNIRDRLEAEGTLQEHHCLPLITEDAPVLPS